MFSFKKMPSVFLLCLIALATSSFTTKGEIKKQESTGNKDWIKIYYQADSIKRISATMLTEVDSIYYSCESSKNKSENANSIIELNIAKSNGDIFSVPIDSITSMVLGGNIPTLYIDTDPYVDEIISKEDFLAANFRYVPHGDLSEAMENPVLIRGRGNTSWYFPKKPYRLKFDKKQTIGSLNKAKSFVLISNYIDNTLMKNVVAFRIGEILGMPYTNIPLPINLVFNGDWRGSYMLTNKIGINSGSVDIDECEGILWEIDVIFDEEYKFTSPSTGLPCMVKDPDFNDIVENGSDAVEQIWNYWQEDLENAFLEIKNGNWREHFDIDQFVNYFFLNDIVLNRELSFPKSFFMYKENKNDKYKLGPGWDFDWAFGYDSPIDNNILKSDSKLLKTFRPIFESEVFREKFQEVLNNFCKNHLDELLDFIDSYSAIIRDSALQDYNRWPADEYHNVLVKERSTKRFDENIQSMKNWIINRIEIIKSDKNFSLY